MAEAHARDARRLRWALVTACFLTFAGCNVETPVPRQTVESRRDDEQKALNMPPRVVTHSIPNGTLLVVDVVAGGSGRVIHRQRCFVWRDAEFKNSSMQCPGSSSGSPEFRDGVEFEPERN